MSYLEEYANKFLEDNTNSSYIMYKNHIVKFIDYVKYVGKENMLMSIKEEDLKASVGYQNKLGNIRTIPSMNNHLEVIKAFYNFLKKKKFHNNIFDNISDYNEFKLDIIREYNLVPKVDRLALPKDVLIKLLKYFEDNIFEVDNSYMLIKLFVKINLIVPTKRNKLANLTFRDFDNDFRWVKINGIKIKIPNSLRHDILRALEKECKNNYKKDDLFFETLYDRTYSDNVFNNPLYKVLVDIDYIEVSKSEKSQSYSVECIMNRAILDLIENNVNPLLVAKINGVSLGTIEKKVQKLNVNIINSDDLLNDAISSLEYYQYL